MKQRSSKGRLPAFTLVAALMAMLFSSGAINAEVLEKTKKVGRGYCPLTRSCFQMDTMRRKTYPAILAFGGGPQTMNTVDGVLDRNFRLEAEKRGYIVIAPAAPNDELFFENGLASSRDF